MELVCPTSRNINAIPAVRRKANTGTFRVCNFYRMETKKTISLKLSYIFHANLGLSRFRSFSFRYHILRQLFATIDWCCAVRDYKQLPAAAMQQFCLWFRGRRQPYPYLCSVHCIVLVHTYLYIIIKLSIKLYQHQHLHFLGKLINS